MIRRRGLSALTSASILLGRLVFGLGDTESGTIWGKLRYERHGVYCPAETGIPAVKVTGELVIGDAVVVERASLRLALIASLQHLPARKS